jgi:hypothetical protein
VLDLAALTGDAVHATGSLNASWPRPAGVAAAAPGLAGWLTTGRTGAASAPVAPDE